MVYQVRLPYATAGIVVTDGTITDAAPIFKWAIGAPLKRFEKWVERKHGSIFPVAKLSSPPAPSIP
jgi:hypothetical protein